MECECSTIRMYIREPVGLCTSVSQWAARACNNTVHASMQVRWIRFPPMSLKRLFILYVHKSVYFCVCKYVHKSVYYSICTVCAYIHSHCTTVRVSMYIRTWSVYYCVSSQGASSVLRSWPFVLRAVIGRWISQHDLQLHPKHLHAMEGSDGCFG